jgi:hypothetical protein
MADNTNTAHLWKKGPHRNGKYGDGSVGSAQAFVLVNFRLSEQVAKDLRALSLETKKTQREHVEVALVRYMRKQKRRMKREKA